MRIVGTRVAARGPAIGVELWVCAAAKISLAILKNVAGVAAIIIIHAFCLRTPQQAVQYGTSVQIVGISVVKVGVLVLSVDLRVCAAVRVGLAILHRAAVLVEENTTLASIPCTSPAQIDMDFQNTVKKVCPTLTRVHATK